MDFPSPSLSYKVDYRICSRRKDGGSVFEIFLFDGKFDFTIDEASSVIQVFIGWMEKGNKRTKCGLLLVPLNFIACQVGFVDNQLSRLTDLTRSF